MQNNVLKDQTMEYKTNKSEPPFNKRDREQQIECIKYDKKN
jgi:hypothetical protein